MTGTIESPIALILLACWIGSVLLVLVLVFQRYCSVYKSNGLIYRKKVRIEIWNGVKSRR